MASSTPIKNVLIIGATGTLAPFIVRALASPSNGFNLTIVTRPSSSSTPDTSNAKVVKLATPYTPDSIAPVLRGQDAVINMTPLNDLSQHELVIDESIKAGVKRYIPPDFGARSDVETVVEMLPLVKGKKDVRELLAKKVEEQGEGGTMSWTAILPGGFLDWAIPIGFLGIDLKNKTVDRYDSGDVQADWTPRSEVADTVVAVLKNPAETANRVVRVASYFVSQNEIIAAVEKALGGQKLEVKQVKWEDAVERGKKEFAEGKFDHVSEWIMGVHVSGVEGTVHKGPDNQVLFGRGQKSQEEFEELVAKAVKGEEV